MTDHNIEIVVSVGTQFSFDRLTSMVDFWIGKNNRYATRTIFQVGKGGKKSEYCESVEMLSPERYDTVMNSAKLLISHAGMGSILSAIDYRLPILMVPRQFSLGEHRNNHQSTTAREFSKRKGIYVANDKQELFEVLDRIDMLHSPEEAPLDIDLAVELEKYISDCRV